MMEVKIEINNTALDGTDQYLYTALERNKGYLDVKPVLETSDFVVLRITDLKRNWKEVSLRIKMPEKAQNKTNTQEELRLYTTKKSVHKIKSIPDLTSEEYQIDRINMRIAMYQDEIDKLNLSIDNLEKDKLAQERDISVLKDKEKYQTDQQKKETAQILSSAETSVKNLENEIAEHKATMRKVFAYLTKSRFINQEIVQDFVTQHMLYQDLKGNCVFVSYDNDIPVFGCLRGTNTYKRFLGDLPGCNYQKGFFINGKGSELIVTESVIDAMSIMSILKEKGLDYKNYSFLSLSGVDKNNALKFHLDHNKKFQSVLLALDNDSAGKKISKLIIKEFADRKDLCITEHYPSSKDWNQEITNFFRFGKPLSDIDFFKKSVTLHIKARKNIIER